MKLAGSTALIAIVAAFAVAGAAAQHAAPASESAAVNQRSPYAGMQHRSAKALSDEQIADLKSGRGMGLALVAELNGYPGPSHVLELADALQLTPGQRGRAKELLDAMKAQAIPLGEKIIAEEMHLERLFVERQIEPDSLDKATTTIAVAQGALRNAHLRYHLAMVDLLTPVQIARYAELRGYAPDSSHSHK